MNKITQIIKDSFANNQFEEDYLYLLYRFTSNLGFFAYQGKMFFMVKSSNPKDIDMDTDYLSLRTNVPVKKIEGELGFEEGLYDYLSFRESIDHHYFDTFVSLCDSYVKNFDKILFTDFCDTMFSLFKVSTIQSEYNLIGLFGELSLIIYFYNNYNINIAKYWHKNGSSSKYDFSFNDFNLEVKTSEKNDKIFTIKHDQLFNDDKIYVALVNAEDNPSGKSMFDIFTLLQNDEPFSKDFNFQTKLAKEFTRIAKSKYYNKLIKVISIDFFDKDTLNSIGQIPSCISKITYDYNFDNQRFIEVSEIIELLKDY